VELCRRSRRRGSDRAGGLADAAKLGGEGCDTDNINVATLTRFDSVVSLGMLLSVKGYELAPGSVCSVSFNIRAGLAI